MERKRPSWDEYFLKLAKAVSERGTCKRRIYGAVIVDKTHDVISTGYCGNPSGAKNCLDIEGPCHREISGIPSGKNYDSCHSVHAEENALNKAGKEARGCVIYISGILVKNEEEVEGKPCQKCIERMINAGIEEVITKTKDGIKHYNVKEWVEDVTKQILSHYDKKD